MLTAGLPGEGPQLQQLVSRVWELEAEHDIIMGREGAESASVR